jgi:hypothetical protein
VFFPLSEENVVSLVSSKNLILCCRKNLSEIRHKNGDDDSSKGDEEKPKRRRRTIKRRRRSPHGALNSEKLLKPARETRPETRETRETTAETRQKQQQDIDAKR